MIWICLGIAAALTLGQPASQPAPPPVAQVAKTFEQSLEELDARVAKVGDLSAEFRQEKNTPLLKKPLVSTGRIRVSADHIRWDTTDPRRSSMLLTADEIRVLYPDDKSMEIYPLEGDLRQFSGTPLPRLSWLRENFELSELSADALKTMTSGPSDMIGLELTPKSDRMREHVSKVRVVMDTRIPCLKKLEMTDPDGHTTTVELTDIKINTGLKTRDLDLQAPEGVKVSRPLGAPRPKAEKPPSPETPPGGKAPK